MTVIARMFGTPQGGGGGSGFTPASGVTISGTFTDGQSVTVTRAAGGLGARANAKPRYWYPLEINFATDDTISRTSDTLQSNGGAAPVIQSTVKPVNAIAAVEYTPKNTGGDGSQTAFNRSPFWDITGDVFMFIKRRLAFDPDNDKIWRIWGDSIGSFPSIYYGVNAAIGTIGASDCPDTVTSGVASQFASAPFSANTWYTDEHYFRNSAINTADGILNWARNGNFAWEYTGRWRTHATAYPTLAHQLFLDEFTNTPPNGSTDKAYYGCILVDDSFLQLMVTPESSYGTLEYGAGASTQFAREIQLQTSRSDTAISFKIRQGSHTTLTGKHLLALTGYGTSIDLGVFS